MSVIPRRALTYSSCLTYANCVLANAAFSTMLALILFKILVTSVLSGEPTRVSTSFCYQGCHQRTPQRTSHNAQGPAKYGTFALGSQRRTCHFLVPANQLYTVSN